MHHSVPLSPAPSNNQTPNQQTQGQPKTRKKWVVPTAVGAVALFVGIGMGGAGGASQEELTAAQTALTQVTEERDLAVAQVTDFTNSAQEEAKKVEEANAAIDTARKELEDSQAELKLEQAKLEEREKAVSGEEKKAKENTFGEGRWIVGEDIKAGSYKTTEPVTSSRCYWAITASGSNGDDILSNDFGTQGNHTVTLKKGHDFESRNCGSWKRQ